MGESKLLLADSVSDVNLCVGAEPGRMKAHYPDKAAMMADWEKLTPVNLKSAKIITDGTITGEYTDLILESETSVLNADGSVDTTWGIREKTEVERLREEVEILKMGQQELKEGQTVQDGAIEDLGAVTSALAEQTGQEFSEGMTEEGDQE